MLLLDKSRRLRTWCLSFAFMISPPPPLSSLLQSLQTLLIMIGTTTETPASIDLVLGPLLIGTIFNAFVYGVCLLQFTIYWTSQWNDPYVIKCVALSVSLHLFHLFFFDIGL